MGAYVLDAMDASQRHAFELHLEDCRVCSAEVEELKATAALLGEAAEAVPPPGLRQRVLDAIDTIRQDPPLVPLEQPAPRRRLQPVFAAAAAVLVFAVVTLGSLYAQTSAKLDRLTQSDTGDDLVAILSAPDARIDDVTVPAGGWARFVWSDTRDIGVLVGEHLQPAPEGHIYALWLIQDQHARYVGPFTPGEQGQVTAVVAGAVDPDQTLGVTTEPAGTITHPTGPHVMSTTLT